MYGTSARFRVLELREPHPQNLPHRHPSVAVFFDEHELLRIRQAGRNHHFSTRFQLLDQWWGNQVRSRCYDHLVERGMFPGSWIRVPSDFLTRQVEELAPRMRPARRLDNRSWPPRSLVDPVRLDFDPIHGCYDPVAVREKPARRLKDCRHGAITMQTHSPSLHPSPSRSLPANCTGEPYSPKCGSRPFRTCQEPILSTRQCRYQSGATEMACGKGRAGSVSV